MKLSLSLLAVGAAASRVAQDEWDSCYSDWIWEECSWRYYQNNCYINACGWYYSSYADGTDSYWVSCDEYDESYCQCDNEWIWEDCTSSYYRDACSWEGDTECGWVYADPWSDEE